MQSTKNNPTSYKPTNPPPQQQEIFMKKPNMMNPYPPNPMMNSAQSPTKMPPQQPQPQNSPNNFKQFQQS